MLDGAEQLALEHKMDAFEVRSQSAVVRWERGPIELTLREVQYIRHAIELARAVERFASSERR